MNLCRIKCHSLSLILDEFLDLDLFIRHYGVLKNDRCINPYPFTFMFLIILLFFIFSRRIKGNQFGFDGHCIP